LCRFPEVVLARDVKAEAEKLRRPAVRDVDVWRRVGAAHVKAVVGALGAHRAEARQELFGLVQVGRLQAAEREVGHFDDGHCQSSSKADRAIIMRPVRTIAIFAALIALNAAAQEPYPSRSMRLVIDTSPGGVTDLFGRLVAEALTPRLGQTVYVDNKPGAS